VRRGWSVPPVGRTAAVYAPPAILLAVCWLRLESPREAGEAIVLLVLALLPALLPALRLRLAGAVVAGLLAAWIALGVSPLDEGGLWRELKDGFLEFYDVAVPFDPAAHPDMHGVLLLALFAAGLSLALVLASRRPFLAVLTLVAGAGWPATLVTDDRELTLGVAILAGALWILAALRAEAARTARPAAVAGALVVLAAGVAASSDAVAKDALLGWERWDLYDSPARPVGVDYVWDARYGGLDFPDKRTVVLRIRAPRRAFYWRATTLDAYDGDHWFENLYAVVPRFGGGLLPADPLEPRRARARWVRQQVEVVGLRDEHLVAASTPVQLRADDLGGVFLLSGGVLRTDEPPDIGAAYTVWSSVAQPTPKQLAAAGAVFPAAVQRYLDVDPRVRIRKWGDPGRDEQLRRLFSSQDTEYLWPYRDMVGAAERVTRGARSPYAAVVALENWFRRSGGFRYDEHPSQPAAGVPPLVDFVLRTKAGYCQHYAGAMALMLRYLGIPARVAVGFTSGRFEDGIWTVTDHDAHAWVEAWFPGYGWLSFDPTPGRGRLSALYTVASDSAEASAAIGAATRGVGGGLDPTAGGPRFDGDGGGAADGGGAVGLVWLLAVLLAAVTLAIGLIKLALRRLRYASRDPRRRAAAARRELADFLLDQGLDVPASATLTDLRRLLSEQLGVNGRPFAAAAGAARYGRPGDAETASRQARSELRALLRAVRSRLSTAERARGWIALRSLRRA
jgi:transglutaminase-like putative cysteine protease